MWQNVKLLKPDNRYMGFIILFSVFLCRFEMFYNKSLIYIYMYIKWGIKIKNPDARQKEGKHLP